MCGRYIKSSHSLEKNRCFHLISHICSKFSIMYIHLYLTLHIQVLLSNFLAQAARLRYCAQT